MAITHESLMHEVEKFRANVGNLVDQISKANPKFNRGSFLLLLKGHSEVSFEEMKREVNRLLDLFILAPPPLKKTFFGGKLVIDRKRANKEEDAIGYLLRIKWTLARAEA